MVPRVFHKLTSAFWTKYGPPILEKYAEPYKRASFVSPIFQLNSVRTTSVMMARTCSNVWHIIQGILLQSNYVLKIRAHVVPSFSKDRAHTFCRTDGTIWTCNFINVRYQLNCIRSTSVRTAQACITARRLLQDNSEYPTSTLLCCRILVIMVPSLFRNNGAPNSRTDICTKTAAPIFCAQKGVSVFLQTLSHPCFE